MEYTIEVVVFYLLLIDAIGANVVAYSKPGKKWYQRNFRIFSRYFPAVKGWTGYYLVLVLWMGVMLSRAGAL